MWAVFYPVERLMAHFCDAIITINREDEARAKTFAVPRVYKLPGVGVNGEKFSGSGKMTPQERAAKRRELGIPEDCYFLLSVGELTRRKNQQVVLQALAQLNCPDIHYCICGRGDRLEKLKALARQLKLADRVHFLGYRMDIPQICRAADCFIFPSRQEGLSFALMEAMETGLPVICSRIRGNTDLIEHGQGGYLCGVDQVSDYCQALAQVRSTDTSAMRQWNFARVQEFELENVKKKVLDILENLVKDR